MHKRAKHVLFSSILFENQAGKCDMKCRIWLIRGHSHNEAYKHQGLMGDTPISMVARKQLGVKCILFHWLKIKYTRFKENTGIVISWGYFLVFGGGIMSLNHFVLSDCMLWLGESWSAWLSCASDCSGRKNVFLVEALADKFFQVLLETSVVGGLVSLAFMEGTILFCSGKCGVMWDRLLASYPQLFLDGKVLNIGYRDRIKWGFFISDIRYRGRYQGYARISSVHIRHYI